MENSSPIILHVCGREIIREVRDSIFRLYGYRVVSTLSEVEGEQLAEESPYDLVLVDVEGDGRIPKAEKLCENIKHSNPDQKIAFICNYRVGAVSDCPDEIIRSDFNPEIMMNGIKEILG